MIDFDVVTLSRLQFGLGALFHFLFAPLYVGLSMLLAIVEAAYVITGREIWWRTTKFWGAIFAISFAMALATGIIEELQLGTHWANFSRYVGNVFGAPLVLEGLAALLLESVFVGLFILGWQRMSRAGHLVVTCLVALGACLQMLWISAVNAWMQSPVGAHFDHRTMRMERGSFAQLLLNPAALGKFIHMLAGGYVLGAVFVLSISAWYLRRARHLEAARCSITVAAYLGLASSLALAVLGDQVGYVAGDNQTITIAAIEAQWHMEKPPAASALFGASDLVEHTKLRIISGIDAYKALQVLRSAAPDTDDPDAMTSDEARRRFLAHEADLGYGTLLLRYSGDPAQATAQQIDDAARSTIPDVAVLFWSFRVMAVIGMFLIALFATAVYLVVRRRFDEPAWALKIAVGSLPLPWIAAIAGWIIAESGRQPWVIEGVLPTFLAASQMSTGTAWISLLGCTAIDVALSVVGVHLILRAIRRGPESGVSSA